MKDEGRVVRDLRFNSVPMTSLLRVRVRTRSMAGTLFLRSVPNSSFILHPSLGCVERSHPSPEPEERKSHKGRFFTEVVFERYRVSTEGVGATAFPL